MKSSLWVICAVTLLCFSQVRCSWEDGDEGYDDILDKTSHEDVKSVEKEGDSEVKSDSSFKVLDDLTKKIGKLYRIQKTEAPIVCDPPCKNDGKCKVKNDASKTKFCECINGFTGDSCEIAPIVCDPPCKNGGKCKEKNDASKTKFCECINGFTGDSCEIAPVVCDPPCKNGGKCKEKDDESKTKFCDCIDGYTGTSCETELDFCKEVCGESDDVVCEGDKKKKDKVRCSCKEKEEKEFDQEAKECKVNYCKEKCGNQKCTGNKYEEDDVKCSCTDPNKDFIEDGKKCIKKCSDDNECQHEGKCEVKVGDSKLCQCKPGLSGDNCEIIDKCVTGDYKNCKEPRGECVFEKGEVLCKCPEGKEFSKTLKYCEVKCSKDDDCQGSNKKCSGGFCICTEGYEGVDCQTVKGCDVLGEKCQKIETECVLDETSKKATCRCKTGFSYNAVENKCSNSFCYPNNPCKNGATCSNEEGFCVCADGDKYYNYQSEKCTALPDNCVLRKSPCSENEECKNGKCVCKYNKKDDEECKRKCDKSKCFPGATRCSDDDDTCYCDKGKYYKDNKCQDIGTKCQLEDYKATCDCPSLTKRKGDSKDCEPSEEGASLCSKVCGYGLCIKKAETETCKCFGFAELSKDKKCVLKAKYCPDGKLQKDSMKCDCTGHLKQADDGITCKLKTCEDDGLKEIYESKGAQCIMDWKTGIRTSTCPPGYKFGKDKKCSDACSYKENINSCANEGKFCYNSFTDTNPFHIECKCPPTVKEETNGCSGNAEYVYLIQNIPVMKKNYKSLSGINKIILNKDLTQSMKQAFGSSQYDYGYLYNYTISGDIVQCSFWVNLKTKPSLGDMLKIKVLAKKFNVTKCDDCDENAVVLAPGLLLSEAGLKDAKISLLKPDSDPVMDNLCGKETFWKDGECFCKDGFRIIPSTVKTIGKYKVVRCEDIDECADGSHSCPENTECRNTIGSYRCDCIPGFKKEKVSDDPVLAQNDKSKCVDLCSPSPCGNGECSLNKDKSFNCQCSPGYGGSRCDRKDENYASAKKGTVVVGAVLGTILALAAVAFLYYIIKIRKNSGSEDFHPAPRMDRAEMTERRPMRGISNRGYE